MDEKLRPVDLDQVRALVDGGGVLSVTLEAGPDGYTLQFETRRGLAGLVVANDRGRLRTFADPRKAFALLRELGIRKGHFAI